MPIGNIDDLSKRAFQTLQQCDLVLCEDTRETNKFLSNFSLNLNLVSYIGNKNAANKALALLRQGANVGVICDRGMPCISDPGSDLVKFFRAHGIEIDCIPGPSSITTAFALSGYHGGFIFHGFLPRNENAVLKIAESLVNLNYNIIFFEAPFRMQETLKLLAQVFQNRNITIAKDLTKTYQKIYQGKIEEFLNTNFQGECVLIISY